MNKKVRSGAICHPEIDTEMSMREVFAASAFTAYLVLGLAPREAADASLDASELIMRAIERRYEERTTSEALGSG